MSKKEVLIAVIGGFIGAVLVMVVGSFSPLGAQNGKIAVFDRIACESITVSDTMFCKGVHVRDGGVVMSDKNLNLRAVMHATDRGGEVIVYGTDGGSARMSADGDQSTIRGSCKDGASAMMRVRGERGEVEIYGEDSSLLVEIYGSGDSGTVRVRGADGKLHDFPLD